MCCRKTLLKMKYLEVIVTLVAAELLMLGAMEHMRLVFYDISYLLSGSDSCNKLLHNRLFHLGSVAAGDRCFEDARFRSCYGIIQRC